MSKLISKSIFLFSLLFIACNGNAQNVELLNPDEFETTIKNNPDYQLIDVRTEGEFEVGHIEGSQNMNFNSPDFQNQVKQLNKNKPLMVYCAAGGRSGRAAELLSDMGFMKIYDLEGGTSNWTAEKKALVKD